MISRTLKNAREPNFFKRWWIRVTKGRHSSYLMVDVEKYAVTLPEGAIVREAAVLPTGTLLAAIDMTYATDVITFSMLNKAKPTSTPKDAPPPFPQHGPVGKQ